MNTIQADENGSLHSATVIEKVGPTISKWFSQRVNSTAHLGPVSHSISGALYLGFHTGFVIRGIYAGVYCIGFYSINCAVTLVMFMSIVRCTGVPFPAYISPELTGLLVSLDV